jgi:CrcB protein
VITGFLGSLTTYSTLSAEADKLPALQRYRWAMLHVGSHLAGSLVMTVLGMYTVRWLSV